MLSLSRAITIILCALLAACGGSGGNSSSSTTPVVGGANTPTTPTGNNDSTATPTSSNPTQSPDQPKPGPTSSPSGFTAAVTAAPSDGATLLGVVRLEVRGSSIENAELLPSSGYSPRLGVFTVSADKTLAWLDFDTSTLPNGTLLVRISAFDQPAGNVNAREIIVMPPRTWHLSNQPPPAPTAIPPASLMPEVQISNLALPYVDPQPLVTMMQLDDTAYASMLANDWPRVQQVMRRYIPANVVLFPPVPLGFHGPWYSCVNGPLSAAACREAMNLMIGLMRSKQL